MINLPYNILIIDDEPALAYILQELLIEIYRNKINIITADNAVDALRIAIKSDIHIVITDIKMPAMSGDQLLNSLKELTKGIDVIIATAYDSYKSSANCFKNGASGYLRKPFSIEELKEVMDPCIQKLDNWTKIFNSSIQTHEPRLTV